MNCKYCKKKGTCSFGWIDFKGEWRSKHLTCKDHAEISMRQQQWECQMEQMRERSRLFAKPKSYLLSGILNP